MTTGKTIALTRWTFVDKVMSLLLNMLSRLVITFLPRSKHLLISWLQSPSAVILESIKIKSGTVSTVSSSISQMPWSSFSECWALSQLFHSPLSLSSRGFLVPPLKDLSLKDGVAKSRIRLSDFTSLSLKDLNKTKKQVIALLHQQFLIG